MDHYNAVVAPQLQGGAQVLQTKLRRHVQQRIDKRQAKGSRLRPRSRPPYFPMQKLEKIRFRMSSAVVSPVSESSWRKDSYKSSSTISWGMSPSIACSAAESDAKAAVTA